jgi:hypothetical protein
LRSSLPADAVAAGQFVGRLAPGLNAFAGVLGANASFQQFLDGGNAGDVVSAIGGLTSTVGAILDATGVGAVVGVPLQVVGSLLTVIGGAISGNITETRQKDEAEEILRELGFSDEQAAALSNADTENLEALDDLGATPEQLQDLAGSHPEIFENNDALAGLAEMAETLHLEGGELEGFLDAAGAPDDTVRLLELAYQQLHASGEPEETTRIQIYNGTLRAMSQAAQDFVAEAAPESSGDEGEARFEANAAFDEALRSGLGFVAIGAAFREDEDPVFQAELVRRLDEYMSSGDQTLAEGISQVLANGGEADVLRDALEAAREADVITADELDDSIEAIDDF